MRGGRTGVREGSVGEKVNVKRFVSASREIKQPSPQLPCSSLFLNEFLILTGEWQDVKQHYRLF